MQPHFRRLALAFLIGWTSLAGAADVAFNPNMNRIQEIHIQRPSAEASLSVVLKAAQPLEYDVRMLSKQDTGVADVVYLNLYRCYTFVQGGRNFDQEIEHAVVRRVRLNQYKLDPPMVRLVFYVTRLVEPAIETVEQDSLRITFPGVPPSPVVETSKPASQSAETTEVLSPTTAPPPPQEVEEPLPIIVLRLQHHPADHLKSVVEPLLSPAGVVVADDWSNSLVLRDRASNLESIRQIVEELDQPPVKPKRLHRRARGTVVAVEQGKLSLRTRSGNTLTLELPSPLPKRLQERLQRCQPGTPIRVRWEWVEDRRVLRNLRIRKVKATKKTP